LEFASLSLLDIGLFILALLVMLVGLIGGLLPVLPGLPIVWGAAFLFAILTGFETISVNYIIYTGLIVAVIVVGQNLLQVYGAKRMGASMWGTIGALIGVIVGIFFGLIGIILFPLIGAFLFEMMAGKTAQVAFKSGVGTFFGFIFGAVLQIVACLILIATFVGKVLFE
jgi:hypothetical protein